MQDAPPEFFAALMSRAGGEVAFFDRDGRYIFVSPALASVNGLSADEHLGRTLREVLPTLAEQLEPPLTAALTGEAMSYEIRGRTENLQQGERIWREHWFPVHDGSGAEVIGAGVSIVDITSLRRAEERAAARAVQQEALAEFGQRCLDSRISLAELHESAVETLVRSLGVPLARVVRVVPGSDVLEFSASFGWRADETPVPGQRSNSYVDFIMRSSVPVRIDDVPTETRFRIPDQLHRHGVKSSIAAGIQGPRGRWGIISGHTTESRRFTDDEAAFVQELANSLSLALSVREARELQRDTISFASHELRTPLTSIIGLGQHLARRMKRTNLDETLQEMVESLTTEAFRLNAIIERWMGFAELQTGMHHAALSPLDLREVVERQVMVAGERHPAMTLIEQVPEAPVNIETDPDKVAGILDNLLENAARYAGTEARVVVRLEVEGDHALISVCDNGPGVAAQHLSNLFDRFYRGEGRIKGGLGIGLYISRLLAEELGGRLSVESAPGEGSTFTLELPISTPAPDEAARP